MIHLDHAKLCERIAVSECIEPGAEHDALPHPLSDRDRELIFSEAAARRNQSP